MTKEQKSEDGYEGTGGLGQAIKDFEKMYWQNAHSEWPLFWKEFADQLFADIIALRFELSQALKDRECDRCELLLKALENRECVDLWKGRHVTDGKTCRTCGGIAIGDCPVLTPQSTNSIVWPSEDEFNKAWQNEPDFLHQSHWGAVWAYHWLKQRMNGEK